MLNRIEEHKRRLMDRLKASPTLMQPDATELVDWVDLVLTQGSLQNIELFTGEVNRIVCDERVNRQIEYNLRHTFGEKLHYLNYVELVKEYRDFSMSDMAGDNDARFLEWLGLEESSL